MTMLEKIARAMFKHDHPHDDPDAEDFGFDGPNWTSLSALACVAIEAMMEPNMTVLNAGFTAADSGRDPDEVFKAMLQAILNEGKT